MLCLENCFIGLRELDTKKIKAEVCGEFWNVVLKENGENRMGRKITNEQVFGHIGVERALLNNILCRKANWIGHILRRNCRHHDAIEGHMTEVKRVRRRTTTRSLMI